MVLKRVFVLLWGKWAKQAVNLLKGAMMDHWSHCNAFPSLPDSVSVCRVHSVRTCFNNKPVI